MHTHIRIRKKEQKKRINPCYQCSFEEEIVYMRAFVHAVWTLRSVLDQASPFKESIRRGERA